MTETKRTMLILAGVGALALILFLRRSSSSSNAPSPLLVQSAPPSYDDMGLAAGGTHVGAAPPGTVPAPAGIGGGFGGTLTPGMVLGHHHTITVHPPTPTGPPKGPPPVIIGGHPGPQQTLSPTYGFEPWITGGAR
jgi:hypothetical protein